MPRIPATSNIRPVGSNDTPATNTLASMLSGEPRNAFRARKLAPAIAAEGTIPSNRSLRTSSNPGCPAQCGSIRYKPMTAQRSKRPARTSPASNASFFFNPRNTVGSSFNRVKHGCLRNSPYSQRERTNLYSSRRRCCRGRLGLRLVDRRSAVAAECGTGIERTAALWAGH